MRIAIAAAEMVPFIKVGGLADVVAAMAKALTGLGHEVTVILPQPASLSETGDPRIALEPVGVAEIPLGTSYETARFDRVVTDDLNYEVILIANERLFSRSNPYVDPVTGVDWPDNPMRFVFLCKAIIEALGLFDPLPDVVHLNDHHTGLVPILLREGREAADPLYKTGILFAIHNMGYQGIYKSDDIVPLLDRHLTEVALGSGKALEFFGNVNFMKAAILYADVITTVSERYAIEIQEGEEHGFGLEGILRTRRSDLIGILNGIDTEIWSPEVDPLIPHTYSASNLGPKRQNKSRLLQAVELPEELDTPVIGMISRLVDQKGFDLLEEGARHLLEMDLKLVILGNGQERYEQLMRGLAAEYPTQFAASLTFNEPLAHLIEAGSDFFLMPSRYEPCGLNQMYSLRYGTIPIVRATGGLADTIQSYDPETGRGNGFVFEEYTAAAMLDAVREGLAAYARSRAWKKLQSTVMRIDHSWEKAARAYLGAYQRTLQGRGSIDR